jgi:hypothetical protein
MIQELAQRIADEIEKHTNLNLEIRAKISDTEECFEVFIIDRKSRKYFVFVVPLYCCKSEAKFNKKIQWEVSKILKEIL